MPCSTSSAGSLAMAEPRSIASRVALRVGALVVVIAILSTGSAPTTLAAPPDETCTPGQTFAAGAFDVCSPQVIGGGGGIAIGGLLPIVLALAIGAGLALVAAYIVLRRRAGGPLDPVDAGEWWTCANCGRQNVVGSARCFSCGAWEGGSRAGRPTGRT